MNEHRHQHDENCSCGHTHEHDAHAHEHHHSGHQHDENGNFILEHELPGEVHTEYHLHDEARVVSGRLTLSGTYDTVRKAVSSQLEQIAAAVHEIGGIVGHIKASCEVKTVDMFSVTDTEVSVKTAPEQEIRINVAAIVFLIDPVLAESLVRQALETVKQSIA
jgi:hypothetical protein